MVSPFSVRVFRADFWSRVADELRPRLKEAGYSLHLMRRSPLTVIGLGIVMAFMVLAIAGPALAPMAFVYTDGEKNSPPFSRPVVQPPAQPALETVGPAWHAASGGDLPSALRNDDDRYLVSDDTGDTLVVSRFQFSIYSDLVTFVGVNVQENSTEGSPGSFLDVSVSGDHGATWSASQATWLRFSDVDNAWLLLDFTSAINWDTSKVGQLAVRIVHDANATLGSGPIGIDALQAVVRFEGHYHVLGTTTDGEDVLTGMLMGAPISMRIAIIVVGLGTLIGVVLGAISGYFGGAFDEAIMRITDVFLSIPGLVLAIAFAAALGARGRSIDTIMYALIIVWWPAYTRLVRGQALSIRENTYVEAARASGSSELRVVARHILPNALSPIIVNASLDMGTVVLVAAGLSFLGLGAQPGTPEWGLLVSKGFSFFPAPNWWQVTFAGFMIFMFTLGWNLLGDGLRDILDPRLRR